MLKAEKLVRFIGVVGMSVVWLHGIWTMVETLIIVLGSFLRIERGSKYNVLRVPSVYI